jgi:zinc protease
VIGSIAASGKNAAEIESAINQQLDLIKMAPVGPAELNKAKTQLITSELRDRQTCTGKAELLGEATVLFGDPERANSEIELLQRVSAEDIQRVARKFIVANNRVVLEYLPEALRKTNKSGE